MFKVYLAGTVTPETRHLQWRKVAAEHLDRRVVGDTVITLIDPLRFQDPKNFSANGLSDKTCPNSLFVSVDINDVLNHADAMLLVYYTSDDPNGYRRQSIGTWIEFGLAAVVRHIPVVVVTDDPEVAEYPFITRLAAYVTSDIHEACARIATFAR